MFGYQLYDMEGGARVSSFFGHELIMGSYLSRLSPLVFGLYILNKNYNKFFSFFIFALFVLIEGLVFLSGERTSFFIINFSTLICLLLLKDFKKMVYAEKNEQEKFLVEIESAKSRLKKCEYLREALQKKIEDINHSINSS
jgi:hypothetical protein